jgi:hypothetical protein
MNSSGAFLSRAVRIAARWYSSHSMALNVAVSAHQA